MRIRRGAATSAWALTSLAILAMLTMLQACGAGTAELEDVKGHFNSPTKIAITPYDGDGSETYVFVLNAYTGTVSVIRVSDQEVVWGKGDKGEDEVLGVGDFPKDLDISPDGGTVYVTDTVDNNIYAIDTGTWEITQFDLGFRGGRPRVDPSGDSVWVLDQRGAGLVLWDEAGATIEGSMDVEGTPTSLAVAPDGDAVYVTTLEGYLVEIDADEMTETARFELVGTPGEVIVSPDGAEVYALASGPPRMFVLDRDQGSLRTVELLGLPRSLASSPDGLYVYITNSDGYLYVYDVALGRPCGASATTPEFYDKGPRSDPTISEVEVTDCVTQTEVWKLIFDQEEEEWVAIGEESGEQAGRAEEDRRYVSDAAEVSFTISSGDRYTSDGDRFVFETDAGIEPIIVGYMPDGVAATPMPETPEFHYIYVVNTGTHNLSVATSEEFEYDQTIN